MDALKSLNCFKRKILKLKSSFSLIFSFLLGGRILKFPENMNALNKKKVLSRRRIGRRMNKTLKTCRPKIRRQLLQMEQCSSSSSLFFSDTQNKIFPTNETSSSDDETLSDNDANIECNCDADEENSNNEETNILHMDPLGSGNETLHKSNLLCFILKSF